MYTNYKKIKKTVPDIIDHDLLGLVPELSTFRADQFCEMAKACGIEVSIEDAVEQVGRLIRQFI